VGFQLRQHEDGKFDDVETARAAIAEKVRYRNPPAEPNPMPPVPIIQDKDDQDDLSETASASGVQGAIKRNGKGNKGTLKFDRQHRNSKPRLTESLSFHRPRFLGSALWLDSE
jgi:hypothetical protein